MTLTFVRLFSSLEEITLMPEFSLKPFLKSLVLENFLKRLVVVVK